MTRVAKLQAARIDSIFEQLRAQKQCALMPFITGGYPSIETTERVLPVLEEAGASVVEIGFPYSDPIADGPVIASSMYEAIQTGVNPKQIFDLVRRVRKRTSLGLIAMVSASIVSKMEPENFMKQAAESGFDGVIIPDVDLEAAEPLAGLAAINNLSFTLLIAPTTHSERIRHLTSLCSGFIYLLARTGLTGEQHELKFERLRERVSVIRECSELPIAVGFGISTPDQAASVSRLADAVIVGSALVRQMGEADDPVQAAKEFVGDLSRAVNFSTRK